MLILANDENPDVRYAVAFNVNISPEILAKLATDEEYFVRLAVAANDNTSDGILSQLANDDEAFVRFSVAKNCNKDIAYKNNYIYNNRIKCL